MHRVLNIAGKCLAAVVLLSMLAWCAMAVFYSNLPGEWLRTGLAALLVLGWMSALILGKHRGKLILGFVACFALIVLWWMTIPASNDRSWQPDVAVLPYATVEGNRVTVHNIRKTGRWGINFNWPVGGGVRIFHTHQGFPSVEDADDFYINTIQGIAVDVWKGLTISLQAIYKYDNSPPPSTGKGDFKGLLTIGYEREL